MICQRFGNIEQNTLYESPILKLELVEDYYKLTQEDIVYVKWHYFVYTNLGAVVSEKFGQDTVFAKGKYKSFSWPLFNRNSFGLTADNGKRIGTGAYVVNGSYIVFKNNVQQYREFELNKYRNKEKRLSI